MTGNLQASRPTLKVELNVDSQTLESRTGIVFHNRCKAILGVICRHLIIISGKDPENDMRYSEEST